MKTVYLPLFSILLFALCAVHSANAQNTFPPNGPAGIGTTAPDASSLLEIKSTSKGLLIPRMTQAQRNAIASPANGLLIFQTDNTPGLYYYSVPSRGLPSWMSITGANKSLSNLTTTSINQSLLPSANNTFDAGSAALRWNNLYAQNGNFSGNLTVGGNFYQDTFRIMSFNSRNANVGFKAGLLNQSGYANTAVGAYSLYSNTDGLSNTAVGYEALYSTTGDANTATGMSALVSNTTGQSNTANGFWALYDNKTGNTNTAVGYFALRLNQTGYSNVAIGVEALHKNVTASNLVAVGDSALYNSNSSVTGNTAVGSKALYTTTTGYQNAANGFHALYLNTTGSYNTASGSYALQGNTSGNYNTAYGVYALSANTTGIYNTAIGYNAYPLNGAVTNYTGIGYNVGTSSSASNMVEIGNSSVTVIRGAVNFSTYSDGRIKNSIKNNVPGLAFINLLKPATYKIDLTKEAVVIYGDKKAKDDIDKEYPQKHDIEKELKTGFIAQEVEAAAKKVNYDFSGVVKPQNEHDLYSLRYAEFVVPLVKAVQELSSKNDDKDSLIKEQNNRIDALQQQLNELKIMITANGSTVNRQLSAIVSSASLEQNKPNPLSTSTIINYTLPATFSTAQIIITDKVGKTIKQINVSGSGKGSVLVNASLLSAGAYQYALYINNQVVAVRQMIVSK